MKLFKYTAALLCLFALASCALIRQQEPAIELMVTIGTVKAIEASPVDERLERAERVIQISDIALTMLSDKDVLLEGVYAAVIKEIRWHQLSPVDQMLYRSLLDSLADRIRENIELKSLDPDKVATTKIAVGWVRKAALNYAAILDG